MIPGDSLLYVVTPADASELGAYNGDVAAGDVAPAIVTKVHDAETVDLRVLFNGDVPIAWRPRVRPLEATETEAGPGTGHLAGWAERERPTESSFGDDGQAAAEGHPGVPPELVPHPREALAEIGLGWPADRQQEGGAPGADPGV